MHNSDRIEFYLVNAPYGEFSNFARYRIWLGNKSWPTSEHYFQAMKFDSIEDQEEIRNASSPKEAAEKGRDRKRKLKPNWESIKNDIMRDAVWAKFVQNAELKSFLLSTGESDLV